MESTSPVSVGPEAQNNDNETWGTHSFHKWLTGFESRGKTLKYNWKSVILDHNHAEQDQAAPLCGFGSDLSSLDTLKCGDNMAVPLGKEWKADSW